MLLQDFGNRTMEMVAVVLSDEYGVRVVSSGRRAHTAYPADGGKPVITIPAVDTEDENYLVLVRGYIDHEVGHVRFTRHRELAEAYEAEERPIGALKAVCEIYEDVFVERLMGECFPGCARNLRKLVSLIFHANRRPPVDARRVLEAAENDSKALRQVAYHTWTAVAQYILYRVRQEASDDLKPLLPEYLAPVAVLAPGLADRLEPVLASVPLRGTGTLANLALAKETMAVIEGFFQDQWQWPGTIWEGKPEPAPGLSREQQEVLRQLGWVLDFGGSVTELIDVSQAAATLVEAIMKTVEDYSYGVVLHREYGGFYWHERLERLSDQEQMEALQASAMLDAQVHSLLQTYVLNRAGSARIGTLNTLMLHRLATGNSNIFRKKVEKQGLNTEIRIAVDMSGSMEKNNKALMASKAVYAVIVSLRKIPGVKSGVLGFFDDSVLDILRPDDRVTPRMKIKPDGGTLCGEALKFAMQTFTSSPHSRKIIFMLTDGDTDNARYFEQTIERARRAGFEFLGIGIMDSDITQYLEEDECCVIEDLRDLAPEMFRMLRGKLLGGR